HRTETGTKITGDRRGAPGDFDLATSIGVIAVEVLDQELSLEDRIVAPETAPLGDLLGAGELHRLRLAILVEEFLAIDSGNVVARAQGDPAGIEPRDEDVGLREAVIECAVGVGTLV